MVKDYQEKSLKKLREGVADIHLQIQIDRRDAFSSFEHITKFRNYAKGKQDSTLTIEQQKMLEGVLGNDYCDNICGEILSEHTSRLEVDRVTCEDDTVQEWLDDFLQRHRFEDLQERTHRHTLRDGNFCLMPYYDPDLNRILPSREKWWDGFSGVFIGYDTSGGILYAVKEWNTLIGRRRTIYYEGFMERYIAIGSTNTWQPYISLSDMSILGLTSTTALPGIQQNSSPIGIPYVDQPDIPLHIPFVHFSNPGDDDNYGTSIFDGGIVGGQDQVNDVQYDMSAAGRMNGYQRTWSKGYKLKQINGVTVQPRTGPGVHYHSPEKDAAWGTLQAGSIDELIKLYNAKVGSLCRVTGTPNHVITGNWPSGEAAYKLESPIRGRTKSRQKRMAPSWVEYVHRCIELANIYQDAELDEEAMLTCVYTDAGDRDPLTEAMSDFSFWQAAQIALQCGLPLVDFLRINGWGEDQIKGISNNIVIVPPDALIPTGPGSTVPNPEGNNGGPSKSPGGIRPNAPNTGQKPTKATQKTARKQG